MKHHQRNISSLRRFRLGAVSFLAAMALLAVQAWADRWMPPQPRVYASERGERGLKVFPVAPDDRGFASQWQGRLFAVGHDGEDETVWQAPLVCVPRQAFVSRTGAVVTVDEYGAMGYAHSLVVYGAADGKVIADHKLEDLFTAEEIQEHAPATASSRWWAGEAKFSFDESGNRFNVAMNWGKSFSINLADGSIQNAAHAQGANANAESTP
jgi:hypothetical protein